MSSNVQVFQNAKRVIAAHPEYGDEQVADAIGERLAVVGSVIQTARRDLAADTMQQSSPR